MPFRLDEFRAKIQFVTFAAMPHMIYKACLATGTVSNTRYVQEAVCERLARDLGLDVDQLLGRLPAARGPSGHLYDPDDNSQARPGNLNAVGGGVVRVGPGNTVEEVR